MGRIPRHELFIRDTNTYIHTYIRTCVTNLWLGLIERHFYLWSATVLESGEREKVNIVLSQLTRDTTDKLIGIAPQLSDQLARSHHSSTVNRINLDSVALPLKQTRIQTIKTRPTKSLLGINFVMDTEI